MATITIPKKLIKNDDLVVIPCREYEKLLGLPRNASVVVRSKHFPIPKKHEKFYAKLDRDLEGAIQEIREGKAIGPFSSVRELKKVLEK